MNFQFRNIRATIEVVTGITTTNSGSNLGIPGLTLRMAFCCMAVLLGCVNSLAATNFAAYAERVYRSAGTAWESHPNSVTAAVAFAEAAFTRAEFAVKDSERAELANRGMAAARVATSQEPANAAAHYWLGMNIGQLARTKMLGALPLVKQIAAAFERAQELDATVDYAGPHRSLGLLFRDAPGWPTSIGNKNKARHHLERAVKLRPDFPENQLCLLETYEQWAERAAFERQLSITEKIVANARDRFTGEAWAYTRSDWEKRLQSIHAKAGRVWPQASPKTGP